MLSRTIGSHTAVLARSSASITTSGVSLRKSAAVLRGSGAHGLRGPVGGVVPAVRHRECAVRYLPAEQAFVEGAPDVLLHGLDESVCCLVDVQWQRTGVDVESKVHSRLWLGGFDAEPDRGREGMRLRLQELDGRARADRALDADRGGLAKLTSSPKSVASVAWITSFWTSPYRETDSSCRRSF